MTETRQHLLDEEQVAKLEQDYPHAITITLVPCSAYAPARVKITWGDKTRCLNVDDARDLALNILGVASTAESEEWDSCTGLLFEGRMTQASLRWKAA
jgi:hypothetical protein